MSGALGGVEIISSSYVPKRAPTPGEWARRYVRHGLADVLAWLGEEVGPEPGDEVHVAYILGFDPAINSSTAFMRAEIVESLRAHAQRYVKLVDLA